MSSDTACSAGLACRVAQVASVVKWRQALQSRWRSRSFLPWINARGFQKGTIYEALLVCPQNCSKCEQGMLALGLPWLCPLRHDLRWTCVLWVMLASLSCGSHGTARAFPQRGPYSAELVAHVHQLSR